MAKKVTTKRATVSRKPIAGTRPKAPATSKGTGVSKSLVNKSRTVTGSSKAVATRKPIAGTQPKAPATVIGASSRGTAKKATKPLAGQRTPSKNASKVPTSRTSGLKNPRSSVISKPTGSTGGTTTKKKLYG